MSFNLVISFFFFFCYFKARTPSTNKQLPLSKIPHTRENEPTPELWNQKKKIRQKTWKKMKKTTKTTKITMIKQEKKIVKTHEEKKLNPALNHAAIIRKQKKSCSISPISEQLWISELNDFLKISIQIIFFGYSNTYLPIT